MAKFIAMKKLLLLITLIVCCSAAFAQKVDKSSPLPSVQYHSTDTIMMYGRILTDDEINAELVNINNNICWFRYYNNVSYGLSIASIAVAGASLIPLAYNNQNYSPTYFCLGISGALMISSFVYRIIANAQLKNEYLYITPTGVVYKF